MSPERGYACINLSGPQPPLPLDRDHRTNHKHSTTAKVVSDMNKSVFMQMLEVWLFVSPVKSRLCLLREVGPPRVMFPMRLWELSLHTISSLDLPTKTSHYYKTRSPNWNISPLASQLTLSRRLQAPSGPEHNTKLLNYLDVIIVYIFFSYNYFIINEL